ISQKLVNLMGGQVKVDSKQGIGSKFFFRLNMITGNQISKPWELVLDKPNHDYNILIVDDHEKSAALVTDLLNNWGIKHRYISNCHEGIELIKNESFDLVMIDFYLRDRNGSEVALKMKEILEGKPMPEFVLLSPSKASIDILKIKKANQFDFLSKPVLQNDLKDYLLKKFSTSSKNEVSTPQIQESKKSTENVLKILVAEDQIINRKIVTQLLEKKGWIVKAVENGRLATEIVQNENFSIILMDVQMPEMDGFDATRTIRQNEKISGRHTPIVAMTAHAMKGDREKCIEAGMDFYITKPVNPNELFETVQKYSLK
ncbi:MAG: response regulator, partial [Bacteroidales bacterium]|nr:response regulator [Bacteroidales bacterium]